MQYNILQRKVLVEKVTVKILMENYFLDRIEGHEFFTDNEFNVYCFGKLYNPLFGIYRYRQWIMVRADIIRELDKRFGIEHYRMINFLRLQIENFVTVPKHYNMIFPEYIPFPGLINKGIKYPIDITDIRTFKPKC